MAGRHFFIRNVLSVVSVCITVGDDFAASPGKISRDPTTQTDMTWTLSKDLDLSEQGAFMRVYKGPYDGASMSHVRYDQTEGRCITEDDSRLSCIVPEPPAIGKTVGFSVSDITPDDGDRYTCVILFTKFDLPETNDNAILYVFQAPSVILDGATSANEGESVELTCSGTSQSVPTDPGAVLQYAWNITNPPNNHVVNGNTVTIQSTVKANNGKTFTCTVNEKDSTLCGSKTATLDIRYAPGSATIEGIPDDPYIEGETALSLTCKLTGESRGNPAAHEYTWTNLDSGFSVTKMNNDKLELAANEVTADKHNGRWQCVPRSNNFTGPATGFTLIVNARAVWESNLPTTKTVVADNIQSLDVICGITSKPQGTIKWTYNDNDQLPAGVVITPLSPSQSGSKTTVRQRLSWQNPGNIQDRRDSNGSYQCHSSVDLGSVVDEQNSVEMVLTVEWKPDDINLSGDSPTETAVAGQAIPVTRTCVANCNPPCDYTWDGNTGATLIFDPVTKDDHGTYTCLATNKHNMNGINTQFELIVNYVPEINNFGSSAAKPIQSNFTSLTCNVDSRPDSEISIVYKDNGTMLTTATGQTAQYDFLSVQCLDTGSYMCTANNGIGTGDVTSNYYFDVSCPFRPRNITEQAAKALGDNYLFAVNMTANPFYSITSSNWTFTPRNYVSTIAAIPNNTEVSVSDTYHVVMKQIQLKIQSLEEFNYGEYKLEADNEFGPQALLTIYIVPQGPPSAPSAPRLDYATAVSLNIEWTAGFHGGFKQRFSVGYTNMDTNMENWQQVTSEKSFNAGDVVKHKLVDDSTIFPNTIYSIRVRAETEYDGYSEVYGDDEPFETDPEAGFVGGQTPDVTIDSTQGVVILSVDVLNPEYLSSMVTEVCDADNPTLCENSTTTDFSNTYVVVSLPGNNAEMLHIVVIMYDREDIVFVHEFDYGGSSGPAIGVIVGVVIAVVVVLVVTGILLFIFMRKKKKSQDDFDRRISVTYENVINGKQSEDQLTSAATYEDLDKVEMTVKVTPEPVTYELFVNSTPSTYNEDEFNLDQVINKGQFFHIWVAAPKADKMLGLPKRFVAKQVAVASDIGKNVLWEFVQSQGKSLLQLKDKECILACIGISSDMLLLENAPLGNLHQYLKGLAEDAYVNMDAAKKLSSCMSFIYQVVEGVKVVDTLKPAVLHYCLSASDVLLFNNNKVKLYNFAGFEDVKAREEMEKQTNAARLYRWMAPETVTLKHCKESDIWSLAVLIWEILNYGKIPLEDISDEHLASYIENGQHPIKTTLCSPEIYGVLSLCWRYMPSDRPTADEVQKRLCKITQYEAVSFV